MTHFCIQSESYMVRRFICIFCYVFQYYDSYPIYTNVNDREILFQRIKINTFNAESQLRYCFLIF